LIDANHSWRVRFQREQKSLLRQPYVFVDHWRRMPNGQPALLKSRRPVRLEDAIHLWKQLLSYGWQQADPLWGPDAEP
jgi:hypothetical protein